MPHDVMDFRRVAHERIGSTLRRLESVEEVVRSSAAAQWDRQIRDAARRRRRNDLLYRTAGWAMFAIGVLVIALGHLLALRIFGR